MDKRILITGKSGTVGSNLSFGFGYPSSRFNLQSFLETVSMIKESRPDTIVHCAAKVGGLLEHMNKRYSMFYDNLLINSNVIHAAQQCGVKRVLSMLSSCIFAEDISRPSNEHDIYTGEPFLIHQPYGHSKRILEFQSRMCYEEFGLVYNCIIPTNIYGVNDNFNLETGHVVAVLIHKCYLAQKNNLPFVVWGDGNQERQFLYVSDVANCIEWALDNYLEKEPIVLCNNVTIKIKEIVDLIVRRLDFKGKVIFDTSKPAGQKNRHLDGDKLLSIRSGYSFVTIEDGINKTVDWFVQNYETARK